ncbi:MAG TPA: tetratricopeptide repeat protein, partial [Rhodospirillales bacterium]|nr:tetratricopeptide repeat protein [Rhodospirillales bacterium]
MKAILLVTGGGPLVVLTSYSTTTDPAFLAKLRSKGIDKFLAWEIPYDLARSRYGAHFQAVAHDVKQADDLRILDYNGNRAFSLFRFDELGPISVHESGGAAIGGTGPGAAGGAGSAGPSGGAAPWPLPGAGRQATFRVMVADLVGDAPDHGHSAHIASSLRAFSGIEVERRSAALRDDDDGDPVEALAAALRTGRAWLRGANADVLIWGRVADDGKTLRLRFLSAAVTPFGEVRAYRPVGDALELPADFGDDLAAIVHVTALAWIDPVTEEQAQALARLLVPAAERAEQAAAGVAGLGPAATARVRLALATAAMGIGRSSHRIDWLERAVEQLQALLAGLDRGSDPELWALGHTALGNALRLQGEMQQNAAVLEEALAAYDATRDIYTESALPLHWAIIENNRGATLWALGLRRDDVAVLESAVGAYRAALQGITRTRLPVSWAVTENNLGIALRALGEREQGVAHLNEAVAVHQQALQSLTRETLPLHWARTQLNLGSALQALGERSGALERLDEAAASLRAAIDVYAPEHFPLERAMAESHLGGVMLALARRPGNEARIDDAAAAFRASAATLGRERLPLQWARIQVSLGDALRVQ